MTKEDRLEEAVGTALRTANKTIAVAESCTGGRIASMMTAVSGSSGYFELACVTYSNRAKERLLSVPKQLLKEKGAVSVEVAAAMAEGIRKVANVDLGLATTGIAGPEGGNARKPVGLVFFALSDQDETKCLKHFFQGNREQIQSAASQMALDMVRQYFVDKFFSKKE